MNENYLKIKRDIEISMDEHKRSTMFEPKFIAQRAAPVYEKVVQKSEKRLSWDEYFMAIAELVAKRSTCLRRNVGAVLVKDNHIISTGYNGPPKGVPHCDEKGGCIREILHIPSGERLDISRAAHAEQNAIVQAAANGISTLGSVLYCTNFPCSWCAKTLINAGVKKIIYKDDYNDDLAKELLMEAGMQVIKFYTGDKYAKKEDE